MPHHHHNNHIPHSDDPKVQAYIEKLTKRQRTVDHLFRRALHIIERIIAIITILALLAALGIVWMLILLYVVRDAQKKRKNQK